MVWNTTQTQSYRKASFAQRPSAERGYEPQADAERSAKQSSQPFLRIFGDRDSMLILGIIIILMSERADKKLIFALAIAMLV